MLEGGYASRRTEREGERGRLGNGTRGTVNWRGRLLVSTHRRVEWPFDEKHSLATTPGWPFALFTPCQKTLHSCSGDARLIHGTYIRVTYRLGGAVVVELGGDVLPHVGEDGGDHGEAAEPAEAERVSERDGEGSVIQTKAFCSLVHDEEHWWRLVKARCDMGRGSGLLIKRRQGECVCVYSIPRCLLNILVRSHSGAHGWKGVRDQKLKRNGLP